METLDKQYIELINKEIDHIISPDEKIKLDKYLSENKFAKEYYEELRLTEDYLDKLPVPAPSENLKKQIINSIDFSKYSPKAHKQGFFSTLFAPKFKLAYTFAVGLLVGIICYAILVNNSNNINIDDIYGTIGTTSNANTINEFPLNYSDISGKIELKKYDNNFWFNLDLNSTQQFDIKISFPEQVKFSNIRLGLAKDIKISKGPDFIKTTNAGHQKYSLLFLTETSETAKVKMQVFQSGSILFEKNLVLKK
ncbi:MAG TPA: hypothetical protein VKA26_08635 [Ignavibacteriaceae bacterium]|nr:hypothetical protein [Ignavibacteriaceae bacterium]